MLLDMVKVWEKLHVQMQKKNATGAWVKTRADLAVNIEGKLGLSVQVLLNLHWNSQVLKQNFVTLKEFGR